MQMKTLLVGYRAGDLDAKALEGDVVCHVLDVYDRHAIEKAWGAKCVCSPHLPEGPWDLVRFRTGPKVMSGELSLDASATATTCSPRSGTTRTASAPLPPPGRPQCPAVRG